MADHGLAQRALIRPQYHFRQIDGHLYSWDVRKLLVLANGLPIQDTPLIGIKEIDEPYWFGEGGDEPTCRRIMDHAAQVAGTDLAYPILLCADGRIMDGMHRVMKAVGLGHTTIKARRLLATPPPDFIDVAPEDLDYTS